MGIQEYSQRKSERQKSSFRLFEHFTHHRPNTMQRIPFVRMLIFIVVVVLVLHLTFNSISKQSQKPTLRPTPPPSVVQYIGQPRTYVRNGLVYPNGLLHLDKSLTHQATARANGAFIVLARNSDLYRLKRTIREVEARFNNRYRYPYIFLNQENFSNEFKAHMLQVTQAECKFGRISSDMWGYPEWIDLLKAYRVRESMGNIVHGRDENWRHMARFYSGFFFDHPLVKPYDYYWRLEAGVSYPCDLDYDPFMFMQVNKKQFSFVITLRDNPETLPGLWQTTKNFMQKHPEFVKKYNALKWVTDDNGESYNYCHFWSNFELGDLNFFRSKAYRKYFEYLDRDGGFYYERWGDAPVHSVAAAMLLRPDEIHFFNDIGYYHEPTWHCPREPELQLKCSCDPYSSVDDKDYSCTTQWLELSKK